MFDHQMDIQRLGGRFSYVAHVVQRHGEICHKPPVHDVDVEGVDAARFQVPDLLLQIPVVRAHHRRHQFKLHNPFPSTIP